MGYRGETDTASTATTTLKLILKQIVSTNRRVFHFPRFIRGFESCIYFKFSLFRLSSFVTQFQVFDKIRVSFAMMTMTRQS